MKRKHIVSSLFLITLVVVTVWIIVKNNDMEAVVSAIKQMRISWLVLCIAIALLFVAMEGLIIWYLLRPLNENARLKYCISWSFIGNFFSGITPSATGGQPAQLYYMKHRGIKISESTPVLMTVAVLYKFVLVISGIAIFLFWNENLRRYFGGYLWAYCLGLSLNIIVVAVLLFVMVSPDCSKKVVMSIEKLLLRIKVLKHSEQRTAGLIKAVAEYQEVVTYFKTNPLKMAIAVGLTFFQRICAFCMTYLVYCGMGMSGTKPLTVVLLQACIIIASDMLPLPGSAGVAEMLYGIVFAGVFSGSFLTASMCISRGISFYMVLLVSLAVLIYNQLRLKGISK